MSDQPESRGPGHSGPHHQNPHHHDNRYRRNFRGRSPGQSRIYKNLGVRDLRELLDRKRGECQAQAAGVSDVEKVAPPPDPPYNYLRDPLRENTEDQVRKTRSPRRHHPPPQQNKPEREDRDIRNPPNIKIEFSTSTGEHTYSIDADTTLPTIKHVPDQVGRGFNSGRRGRGRGRGRFNYPRRGGRGGEKGGDSRSPEKGEVGDEEVETASGHQDEGIPENPQEVAINELDNNDLAGDHEQKSEDTVQDHVPTKNDDSQITINPSAAEESVHSVDQETSSLDNDLKNLNIQK